MNLQPRSERLRLLAGITGIAGFLWLFHAYMSAEAAAEANADLLVDQLVAAVSDEARAADPFTAAGDRWVDLASRWDGGAASVAGPVPYGSERFIAVDVEVGEVGRTTACLVSDGDELHVYRADLRHEPAGRWSRYSRESKLVASTGAEQDAPDVSCIPADLPGRFVRLVDR